MSVFIGLCLLAAGIPTLAGGCAMLRWAIGRAEEGLALFVLLLAMAATVGGGLLLTS